MNREDIGDDIQGFFILIKSWFSMMAIEQLCFILFGKIGWRVGEVCM